MAIVYRIYSNRGSGGPVDYSAPIASTNSLTWVTGPVGPSADTTFVVRAFDPVTGLEESNTEARLRVAFGPDGTDITGRPNPPHALSVSPTIGGGCRVAWAYAPAEPGGVPTGFHVYLTPGNTVDSTSQAGAVPYTPGKVGYSLILPGPYTLSTYTAAVCSFNASGDGVVLVAAPGTFGLPTTPFVLETVRVQVSSG